MPRAPGQPAKKGALRGTRAGLRGRGERGCPSWPRRLDAGQAGQTRRAGRGGDRDPRRDDALGASLLERLLDGMPVITARVWIAAPDMRRASSPTGPRRSTRCSARSCCAAPTTTARDCGRGVLPRDDQLDVAGASLSPGLRAMTDRAGAAAPFAQAAALLADLAGDDVDQQDGSSGLAEADGAAATAAQAEDARGDPAGALVPPPPSGPMPDMLYLAVDGTGMPMRPAETTGRAGKGPDGRARTREVKLAALFTQTKTDDDGHPIRDPDSTSYLATLEPVEHFADLVQAEARRRGSEHIRQLVVIGDGARWIWNLADQRFPEATQIVDLYHAREHLHELAALLEFIIPDPTRGWPQRLTELDKGEIEALSAAARLYDLSGPKADIIDKAVTYFQTNAHRMRYAYYRKLGMFVGSGVVEAGCKSVLGATTQTLRHALDHPRRHRHHHPALPTRQPALQPARRRMNINGYRDLQI